MINTAQTINPAFQLFILERGMRINRKPDMAQNDKPIREITNIGLVMEAGERPRFPEGDVSCVHYADGTKREIFIPADEGCVFYEETVFLKEGRKTLKIEEIESLQINDPDDPALKRVREKLESDAQKSETYRLVRKYGL